uniref:DUF5641 domain-containing protein n=1 Tax=Trichuris muris TaxID=70415 RepID=A0A5S6QCW6_TRIMR
MDLVFGSQGSAWLQPGDPVPLREGSNPIVDSYTTARIIEVFLSDDGYASSVHVETQDGRPLVRDISRISIIDGAGLERKRMPVAGPPSGRVWCPEPQTISLG